jgi:hypothetical protein
VENLIKENIIPNFDYSNVIDYLENSYLKLSSSKENSLPVNISWFELFIKSIEFVSKNIIFYLTSENSGYLQKLCGLNKKILEELIDKSIEQFISNPFILDDEILEEDILNNFSQIQPSEVKLIQQEIFERLIYFLHYLRNTNNIFDLLMNEYLRISCEENLKEINSIPNPTLEFDIPIDLNNYYKEFTIDMNICNKICLFIINYKESDDSLNVSFKICDKDNKSNHKFNCINNFHNNNSELNREKKTNKFKNPFEKFTNNIKKLISKDDKNIINKNNDEMTFDSKNIEFDKFSSFKILTFLSVVCINDDKSKIQVNKNIISNSQDNQNSYCIFRITNFNKYIDDIIINQLNDDCKSKNKNKNKRNRISKYKLKK